MSRPLNENLLSITRLGRSSFTTDEALMLFADPTEAMEYLLS